MTAIFKRVLNKLKGKLYCIFHKELWGKRAQINGIPQITGIDKLTIGKDVSFNEKCFLQCGGGVEIGNRVTLSHGVTILTVGLDTQDYFSNSDRTFREHIKKSVSIGDGTWCAANVTICPGTVIPERCIVAAGSVVCGHLEESDCIYGGVPARKIKKLEKTVH